MRRAPRRRRRGEFAERLRAAVGVPVETWDERFTTRMAQATPGRQSEHSRAAAHLLQSWLEAQQVSRRGPRRVALAALALLGLAVCVALFQPFAGNGGDPVRVQVPKAAGVSDIADLLEQRGVVSSSTLFEVRATLAGDRGNLKPGVYELREDMPYGDVLDRLTAGPSEEIVRVTIPEGLSRREITPWWGAPA